MGNRKQGYALNEYATLKEVLMCLPEKMKIKQPLNEAQKKYKKENINQDIALRQHEELRKTLEAHDVKVKLLPVADNKTLPEQVFTRDLGFASDNGIFLGRMNEKIRNPETDIAKNWLEAENWNYEELRNGSLECGDVLIDGDVVYVGKSNRTTETAIKELKKLFFDKKIVVLPIGKKYLHLDCVFNIIAPRTAILHPDAFAKEDVRRISMHYRTIVINADEQFHLGTNVLSIGNDTIISLPGNNRINNEMKEWGFNVIEVEFSEIIKSGGAFRCVTFPLLKHH
ncbi:dimethylarginine dimethylaminohydrolase family protein [Salibacterium salarium]|nr:arginine deiminase family protein [Salibacterium salarium]